MTTKSNTNDQWLVVEGLPGLTIAPSGTPLTRLRYYDGKFLRARDLDLEQNAQRRLVHLSNQAGGFGIVHGFDTRLLTGDMIEVGPGQAIDAAGKLLLLPMEVAVPVNELIARSQQQAHSASANAKAGKPDKAGESFHDCASEPSTPQPGTIASNGNLWLVTIAHAEFLCGEEDVYGKLCEQACVGSSERPLRLEGVSLRARPLTLTTPLATSRAVPPVAKHLRSRVASAYFTDERGRPASLISSAGLRSKAWCHGSDLAAGEIALGVLCRQGASNLWFDAWTVRRERMDGPPRDYWAHRMAMRPWREYLAQILQFQCQLAELSSAIASEGGQPIDLHADEKEALSVAQGAITKLLAQWGKVEKPGKIGRSTLETLTKLQEQLGSTKPGPSGGTTNGPQVLVDGGIVELPPAGYLPVDPNSTMTVNEQVRRLLGDGVDLRFCVIRPDDAARELEGAQHMDRISLLSGLDDPSNLPQVDILVPDGRIIDDDGKANGRADARRILGPAIAEGSFVSHDAHLLPEPVVIPEDAPAPGLTPSPSAPADTLIIAGVRDWVLFHARHHRQCAPAAVVQQPSPSRRYKLYALPAQNAAQVKRAIRVLTTSGGDPDWFVELGDIEYTGGVALRTSDQVIETMWSPHGRDHVLVWAGIASVGTAAADGAKMGHDRLLELEAVVERVSPAIDDQDSKVLYKVPDVLDIGDADGVIVLILRPAEQEKLTLSLFRAPSLSIESIKSMLESETPHIPSLFRKLDPLRLGEFKFQIDSDTPSSSAIDKRVQIDKVPLAFLLTQVNDRLPDPKILRKQVYAATLAVRKDPQAVLSIPKISHHQLHSGWDDSNRVVAIICTVPDEIES